MGSVRLISVVLPSRARVSQAERTLDEWRAASSGRYPCEYVISVDQDDADVPAYRELAERVGAKLTVYANRSMVSAANRGFATAAGDLLVLASDDFGCPQHWDAALVAAAEGRDRAAILVADGVFNRLMTLPVLTRDYYASLGFVYHPSYQSMHADDDLTEVAKRDGVLVDARHLLFPHRHHSVGLSMPDAVSIRQSGNRAWWIGWRTFQRRRLGEFGRKRPTWRTRLAVAGVYTYTWIRFGGSWLVAHSFRVLPGATSTRLRWLRTSALRSLRWLTAVDPTDLP